MHPDQRHPGWRMNRPKVNPSRRTTSTRVLSGVRTSSALSWDFTSNFETLTGVDMRNLLDGLAWLDPCFEHEVEGRLRRAPDARESGFVCDAAQARFTGLRSEGRPALRERVRNAEHRRSRVEDAAHRVVVILAAI